MMSTARVTPTTWWYSPDNTFSTFFVKVANLATPQQVFTISYSGDEYLFGAGEMNLFEIEAKKLALVGTTIVAAAGDDGAHDRDGRGNSALCASAAYVAQYPASSQWVLAVGATQVY